MTWLQSIRNLIGFGYDATAQTTRRKQPVMKLQSEDNELTNDERGRLITTHRDLVRNYSICKWAVSRHLDYVTTFDFQAATGNDVLDKALNAFVAKASKKENFDTAGRHSRQKFVRMAEARRVIDGDCGVLKVADGTVQAIESDRVRHPYGDLFAPQFNLAGKLVSQWTNGVQVDRVGRALQYAICNRGYFKGGSWVNAGSNNFELDKVVAARNLYLHAHINDRFDQVRGISPLASAANDLRDTYEGFDFARGKMKAAQLLGITFYRESDDPLAKVSSQSNDDDGDGDESDSSDGYKIDFSKGIWGLDLDPGDRAEIQESRTPATETQAFLQMLIAISLKALDIPFSFFNENFTNYSGSRLAYLQYESSADIKRTDVRDMLDDWTAWRLALAIIDGEFPGLSIEQLGWLWIHRGQPWLDPLKEIVADLQAISSGLDNYIDVAQRHGRDFYENVRKNKLAMQFAVDNGVPLTAIPVFPVRGAVAAKGAPTPDKATKEKLAA